MGLYGFVVRYFNEETGTDRVAVGTVAARNESDAAQNISLYYGEDEVVFVAIKWLSEDFGVIVNGDYPEEQLLEKVSELLEKNAG